MQAGLLILLLSLAIGLQPVSTDLYLPALPSLTRDLGAPVAAGQLTLSALQKTAAATLWCCFSQCIDRHSWEVRSEQQQQQSTCL